MQKINREDVVQAALTVERWCEEHWSYGACDCPFADGKACWFTVAELADFPNLWNLEDFLRTRGLKRD